MKRTGVAAYERKLASLLEAADQDASAITPDVVALEAKQYADYPNYNADAAYGCHIAHYDAPWVTEVDEFRYDDYGLSEGDHVPDFSVDPDDFTLTVLNPTRNKRSFFLTTPHRAVTGEGVELAVGECRSQDGQLHHVTTFILVLAPMTTMEVCRLDLQDAFDVTISSDVKDVNYQIKALREHVKDPLAFPLVGGPFMCSQGWHGGFTHFFPGTCHAIDFGCPVGTSVVAVDDGTVVEIEESNNVSGIHVDNLFKWNSVMIRTDVGIFVEYVHIKCGSCKVSKGDRVTKGQQICLSGDVGFCPTPHLHFQVHLSADKDAATVKFEFASATTKERFLPIAGRFYDTTGEVEVKL